MSDKCQIVDCDTVADFTELWRIKEVRAFVRVCGKHSAEADKGTRTTISLKGVTRVEGSASREAMA